MHGATMRIKKVLYKDLQSQIRTTSWILCKTIIRFYTRRRFKIIDVVFYVLLTVHLSIILVIDQLNAQILVL